MLKAIRSRLKIILWSLIIAFVAWEIGTVITARQGPSVYAGSLLGHPVSIQEYQAALEAVRHRAVLTYGDRAGQMATPEALNQQAWDLLLLTRAARRAGIRIPDQEVVTDLMGWPLLQKDGRYDPATYQAIVRFLGTTPRAFEEEVRNQLAIRKLAAQAAGTPSVTDAEVEAAFQAEEETIRVAYLLFEPDLFLGQVTITDAEVRGQYDAYGSVLRTDPKVQVRYVLITPEQVFDSTTVSDADALEAYLRNVAEAQRTGAPDPGQLDAVRRELRTRQARERAADVAWELRGGWKTEPDLLKLAQPHGLTVRETTPFGLSEIIPAIPSSQQVARAAFDLKPGEISPVLDTPEGYYVFTLSQSIPSEPLPMEQAVDQIRSILAGTQARGLAHEAAQNWVATVQELVLSGSADPLTPVANQAGLELARTAFIKRSSSLGHHGTAGALLNQAFDLKTGEVGGPWSTPRGWVIAQLLERQPANREQLNQAADRLRTQLLEQKRRQTLEAWLQKLKKEAKLQTNPKFAPASL